MRITNDGAARVTHSLNNVSTTHSLTNSVSSVSFSETRSMSLKLPLTHSLTHSLACSPTEYHSHSLSLSLTLTESLSETLTHQVPYQVLEIPHRSRTGKGKFSKKNTIYSNTTVLYYSNSIIVQAVHTIDNSISIIVLRMSNCYNST